MLNRKWSLGAAHDRRIYFCPIGGGPLELDVTVVHPLALSRSLQRIRSGDEVIKQAEAAKITQHDIVCCQSNIEFKPFVLSTFGK